MDSIIEQLNANLKIVYRQALDADKKLDELQQQGHGKYPRVQALSGKETLTETFAYTLTDADGDTSPATLTITVTGTDDGVSLSGLASEGSDVSVSEANLEEGSAADAAALTQPGNFTFASVDGVASVQVGNQSLTLAQLQGLSADSPVVVDTEYGSLSLTGFTPADSANPATGGSVSYSYTLDTRVDNDSQAGPRGHSGQSRPRGR